MLKTIELPARIPHLNPSLPNMYAYYLPHSSSSFFFFFFFFFFFSLSLSLFLRMLCFKSNSKTEISKANVKCFLRFFYYQPYFFDLMFYYYYYYFFLFFRVTEEKTRPVTINQNGI
jgi:hypothetical protein